MKDFKFINSYRFMRTSRIWNGAPNGEKQVKNILFKWSTLNGNLTAWVYY